MTPEEIAEQSRPKVHHQGRTTVTNRAEQRRQSRPLAKKGQTPNVRFRDEKFTHDELVKPSPVDTVVSVGVTQHDGIVYVLGEVQTPSGKTWAMLRPDDAETFGEQWITMARIARHAARKIEQ